MTLQASHRICSLGPDTKSYSSFDASRRLRRAACISSGAGGKSSGASLAKEGSGRPLDEKNCLSTVVAYDIC